MISRTQGNPLANAVEQLLAPNGPMAKARTGFVHSPEQVELARAYAIGIGAPNPKGGGKIGAIEAATGMGKTIAYLSVLGLNAALTGEKALLSTRTRALQRQIVEQDGPAVCEAVRIQTGQDIGPLRLRIGRGNYPDADRIRRLADELRREDPNDPRIKQLRNIVELVSREADAATFDDLRQNFGIDLPDGVSSDIVRLTAASSESASKHYNQHREAGRDASIVVVNHALALMDARTGGGLFAADAQRMVALFDEADTLPDQARSMIDEQVDIETLRLLTDAAPDDTARDIQSALGDLRRQALEVLKHGAAVVKPGAELPELALKFADAVRQAEFPKLFSEIRDELRAAATVLKHWAKAAREADPYRAATIIPAPTRNRPAFSLCSLSPATVLGRLWRKQDDENPLFRAVVFTSATLSSSGGVGDQYNPDRFLRAVNAPRGEINYDAIDAFAPAQFGEMQFVLADRDVPHPLERNHDDETAQANPEFLQYTANAIRVAAKQGGRILILAPSFEFARQLGAILAEARTHQSGESLTTLLKQFEQDAAAILITPSAWEGINLPGLIQHLVIPRIPFPPPAKDRIAALEEKFRADGKSPDAAKHILQAEDRFAAIRKLRQGIGRGIRRPSDRCKLWLLDPRFPLPASMTRDLRSRLNQGHAAKHSMLIGAIPLRFRKLRDNPFERAELLNLDGQIRQLRL